MATAPKTRLGRRPGQPDTRSDILAAAWKIFSEDGYDKTSMRGVARMAGCDPKLVHHYFGSKQQLLVEAMHTGIDTDEIAAYIVGDGIEGVGVRFFTSVTSIYDSPAGTALAQPLAADEQARTAFWQMMSDSMNAFIASLLPGDDAQRQPTLAQSQALVAGFVLARYVERTPPASELSKSQAIQAFGTALQLMVDHHIASVTK